MFPLLKVPAATGGDDHEHGFSNGGDASSRGEIRHCHGTLRNSNPTTRTDQVCRIVSKRGE